MKTSVRIVAATLLAGGAACAEAARPMITDDARMVDAKACQVEAWARRNRDSTEFWALPACNPTGDFELTFGGGRTRERGDDAFTDHQLQVKAIVKPLETNGWGLAVAVGTVRHPRREQAAGWPGDPYFYVPLSKSLADDAWVAHFNAGAARRRDEGTTTPTWGFGNEIALRHDTYLIGEIFRSERGRPFYQAGIRYWVLKDRLQMDATYGNRAVSESGQRWISIGLRLLSPPWFP